MAGPAGIAMQKLYREISAENSTPKSRDVASASHSHSRLASVGNNTNYLHLVKISKLER